MKILPLFTETCKSIKHTSKRVSRASSAGYEIGMRTSKIYKASDTATIYNITKSVGRKVAQQTTIDDLPIISGAIGMLIPIPLASPILLVLGKVAQIGVKALHKA